MFLFFCGYVNKFTTSALQLRQHQLHLSLPLSLSHSLCASLSISIAACYHKVLLLILNSLIIPPQVVQQLSNFQFTLYEHVNWRNATRYRVKKLQYLWVAEGENGRAVCASSTAAGEKTELQLELLHKQNWIEVLQAKWPRICCKWPKSLDATPTLAAIGCSQQQCRSSGISLSLLHFFWQSILLSSE